MRKLIIAVIMWILICIIVSFFIYKSLDNNTIKSCPPGTDIIDDDVCVTATGYYFQVIVTELNDQQKLLNILPGLSLAIIMGVVLLCLMYGMGVINDL